jgi:hypothetical protein
MQITDFNSKMNLPLKTLKEKKSLSPRKMFKYVNNSKSKSKRDTIVAKDLKKFTDTDSSKDSPFPTKIDDTPMRKTNKKSLFDILPGLHKGVNYFSY